jgi:hypothetical protein
MSIASHARAILPSAAASAATITSRAAGGSDCTSQPSLVSLYATIV